MTGAPKTRKRPLSSEEASEWLAGYRRAVASHDAEIAIENQKSSEAQFASKESSMQSSVELITPNQAGKYLQLNTSNRKLRKTLVSQYARDMVSGNWRLTHQGIAFDCRGTLLDGQHRLAAIVESGLPVQMLVTRGVDSRHQLAMDDHAKRSAGDALTLARSERVTEMDVAIIRAAIDLQERRYARPKTKAELNDLLDEFRGALDFTGEFLATKHRGVTSSPVWGAIAMAWFYVEDLDRLRAFCRILCGIDMATERCDRAPQLLREWLLRTGARHSSDRHDGYRKAQRAIVAFMKRQHLDRLSAASVYYPWPLSYPVRTRA